MFRALLTAALLSLTTIPAAQAQELPELNIYGGLSAPTGDFADDGGADAGYASIGFGVMGEYVQPLGSPGLGFVANASLLVNNGDDDILQGADAGRYFIIPAMGGLRYRTELSPTLDGYALGQAGLTAARAPKLEAGDEEATTGFATSFGFGFGGGIVLNDNINITARYLLLGEPDFEYEDDDGNELPFETTMNIFQVMIGIPIGN